MSFDAGSVVTSSGFVGFTFFLGFSFEAETPTS